MTLLSYVHLKCLLAIPLTNSDGKYRGETYTSKNAHNIWKICEAPKPYWASVADYDIYPLLRG